MAEFNAGSIEATLELNRDPFIAGLSAARQQARDFERDPIKVRVDAEANKRSASEARSELESELPDITIEAKVEANQKSAVETRAALDAAMPDIKKQVSTEANKKSADETRAELEARVSKLSAKVEVEADKPSALVADATLQSILNDFTVSLRTVADAASMPTATAILQGIAKAHNIEIPMGTAADIGSVARSQTELERAVKALHTYIEVEQRSGELADVVDTMREEASALQVVIPLLPEADLHRLSAAQQILRAAIGELEIPAGVEPDRGQIIAAARVMQNELSVLDVLMKAVSNPAQILAEQAKMQDLIGHTLYDPIKGFIDPAQLLEEQAKGQKILGGTFHDPIKGEINPDQLLAEQAAGQAILDQRPLELPVELAEAIAAKDFERIGTIIRSLAAPQLQQIREQLAAVTVPPVPIKTSIDLANALDQLDELSTRMSTREYIMHVLAKMEVDSGPAETEAANGDPLAELRRRLLGTGAEAVIPVPAKVKPIVDRDALLNLGHSVASEIEAAAARANIVPKEEVIHVRLDPNDVAGAIATLRDMFPLEPQKLRALLQIIPEKDMLAAAFSAKDLNDYAAALGSALTPKLDRKKWVAELKALVGELPPERISLDPDVEKLGEKLQKKLDEAPAVREKRLPLIDPAIRQITTTGAEGGLNVTATERWRPQTSYWEARRKELQSLVVSKVPVEVDPIVTGLHEALNRAITEWDARALTHLLESVASATKQQLKQLGEPKINAIAEIVGIDYKNLPGGGASRTPLKDLPERPAPGEPGHVPEMFAQTNPDELRRMGMRYVDELARQVKQRAERLTGVNLPMKVGPDPVEIEGSVARAKAIAKAKARTVGPVEIPAKITAETDEEGIKKAHRNLMAALNAAVADDKDSISKLRAAVRNISLEALGGYDPKKDMGVSPQLLQSIATLLKVPKPEGFTPNWTTMQIAEAIKSFAARRENLAGRPDEGAIDAMLAETERTVTQSGGRRRRRTFNIPLGTRPDFDSEAKSVDALQAALRTRDPLQVAIAVQQLSTGRLAQMHPVVFEGVVETMRLDPAVLRQVPNQVARALREAAVGYITPDVDMRPALIEIETALKSIGEDLPVNIDVAEATTRLHTALTEMLAEARINPVRIPTEAYPVIKTVLDAQAALQKEVGNTIYDRLVAVPDKPSVLKAQAELQALVGNTIWDRLKAVAFPASVAPEKAKMQAESDAEGPITTPVEAVADTSKSSAAADVLQAEADRRELRKRLVARADPNSVPIAMEQLSRLMSREEMQALIGAKLWIDPKSVDTLARTGRDILNRNALALGILTPSIYDTNKDLAAVMKRASENLPPIKAFVEYDSSLSDFIKSLNVARVGMQEIADKVKINIPLYTQLLKLPRAGIIEAAQEMGMTYGQAMGYEAQKHLAYALAAGPNAGEGGGFIPPEAFTRPPNESGGGGPVSRALAGGALAGLATHALGLTLPHLVLSGVSLVTSAIGAALGGAALGTAALGVGAVGMGTDLAGIGQAGKDIKSTYKNLDQLQTAQDNLAQVQAANPTAQLQQQAQAAQAQQTATYNAYQQAVGQFGRGSSQATAAYSTYRTAAQSATQATSAYNQALNAVQNAQGQVTSAQQALNNTLNGFSPIARSSVLAAAQTAQQFHQMFNAATGQAEATGAQIIQQAIQTGEAYLPTIGKFAAQNMAIIQKDIQPFFTWLKNPLPGGGLGIFTDLEQVFQKHLPDDITIATNAFEILAKTIDHIATNPSFGNFTHRIAQDLVRINTTDLNKFLGSVDHTISIFRTWEGLIHNVYNVIRDLVHIDAGTGTSVIQMWADGLHKLDTWMQGTGGATLHSMFEAHRKELEALLHAMGILISQVGPPLIQLMTTLAAQSAPLLPLIAEIIAPFITAFAELLNLIDRIPGLGNVLALFLVLKGFSSIPWFGIGNGFGFFLNPVTTFMARLVDWPLGRLATFAAGFDGIAAAGGRLGTALGKLGFTPAKGSVLEKLFGTAKDGAAGEAAAGSEAGAATLGGGLFAGTLGAAAGAGGGYLLGQTTISGKGPGATAGRILTTAGGGLLGLSGALALTGVGAPVAVFTAIAGASALAAGEVTAHWKGVSSFFDALGSHISSAWHNVFTVPTTTPAEQAQRAFASVKQNIDTYRSDTQKAYNDTQNLDNALNAMTNNKAFSQLSSDQQKVLQDYQNLQHALATGNSAAAKQAQDQLIQDTATFQTQEGKVKGVYTDLHNAVTQYTADTNHASIAQSNLAASIANLGKTPYANQLIPQQQAVSQAFNQLAQDSLKYGPNSDQVSKDYAKLSDALDTFHAKQNALIAGYDAVGQGVKDFSKQTADAASSQDQLNKAQQALANGPTAATLQQDQQNVANAYANLADVQSKYPANSQPVLDAQAKLRDASKKQLDDEQAIINNTAAVADAAAKHKAAVAGVTSAQTELNNALKNMPAGATGITGLQQDVAHVQTAYDNMIKAVAQNPNDANAQAKIEAYHQALTQLQHDAANIIVKPKVEPPDTMTARLGRGWDRVFGDVIQPIENFVTSGFGGLGDKIQRDVFTPISNFVTSGFGGLGDKIQQYVITPITHFVTSGFGGLGDTIQRDIFSPIAHGIKQAGVNSDRMWNTLTSRISAGASRVGNDIAQPFEIGWARLKNGWHIAVANSERMWHQITTRISAGASRIANDIAQPFEWGWARVKTGFSRAKNDVTGAFKDAKTWLINAGGWIINGLEQGVYVAWHDVTKFWDNLKTWFGDKFKDAKNWLLNAGGWIMGGLERGAYIAWQDITKFFAGLPKWFGDQFKGAIKWLEGAGEQIMNGLWNGMQKIWGDAGGGIVGWISGVVAGGIKSLTSSDSGSHHDTVKAAAVNPTITRTAAVAAATVHMAPTYNVRVVNAQGMTPSQVTAAVHSAVGEHDAKLLRLVSANKVGGVK